MHSGKEIFSPNLENASHEEGFSFPIRYPYLDNPLHFVKYNTATLGRTLDKLGYYRVFPFSTSRNSYASFPRNIVLDTPQALVLYSEFGPPTTLRDDQAKGLAVCGFSTARSAYELKDKEFRDIDSGIVIGQFQTSRFENEREMMHYLGFINYREFFIHVLEQTTLFMKNSGIQLEDNIPQFVGIQKEMDGDYSLGMNAVDHMRSVQRTREDWVQRLGYIKQFTSSGKECFAKEVDDISPDNNMQRHLRTLIEGE